MPDSRALLVLGIDAASPALLREWAGDGTLPAIAALMGRGRIANTESVDGLYVGSTWPSFYTARNPAGHGMCWLEQLEPGTYAIKPIAATDLTRCPSLWEVLGAAGLDCAVLDVPLAPRAPELRGVQVVEWGTQDVHFGSAAIPADLGAKAPRLSRKYPVPRPWDVPKRSYQQYADLGSGLQLGSAARAELTRQVLGATEWDFAIQVFAEAHCAGHQLWHFHDPHHPSYADARSRIDRDLVREVYVSIDTAIASILADVDPARTTVVLLTLHGMSFTAGAAPLIHDLLLRAGAMHHPARGASVPAPRSAWRRVGHAMRRAYRAVPERLRLPLYHARLFASERWLGRGRPINLDMTRTRCFPMETGPLVSGIRLNLRGREPQGILEPGAEADAFCDELTEWLLDVVSPEDGRPLIDKVTRSRDLWDGERIDSLPDLLIEWNLNTPLGSVAVGQGDGASMRGISPRTGEVTYDNPNGRTGEHRPQGLFIAAGPGIAPGALDQTISILDLAPTLAAVFGCSFPATDGAPIPELLQPVR